MTFMEIRLFVRDQTDPPQNGLNLTWWLTQINNAMITLRESWTNKMNKPKILLEGIEGI